MKASEKLVLRQLLFLGYRGKGVRYQKCEAPCGPFGFWYLTPFPLDKRRLENSKLTKH
ncbi:hypothetical protein Enr13x_24320 [Stieleria neptunia]|uniref:Uncharacterized protein n=1 Tax=Stieleria neptunia TaxID=2527979 RepID=A0A518HP14_9BACT|nr:hypothetical protein Enr13x_24320 [Stieleria neptunia]